MKTKEEILNRAFTANISESELTEIKPNWQIIFDAMETYAEQFKPKWISVAERLPEKNCHILVFGSYTRDCPKVAMECIFYHKNNPKYCEFRNSDMSRTKNVTHWMPMPQPPTI